MLRNPIYRKELKQFARSARTTGILVVFNAALMIIGLFAYYISFIRPEHRGGGIFYSDILSIYQILATVEFVLVVLAVPAVSAGSVCGEREKQTLDLLLSTTLSPLRIVVGKLAASLHVVLLLLVSSLPVFGLIFSIGGIRILDLTALYAELFLVAFFVGSVSVLFSVYCKKTTTACVLSYTVLVLLIIVSAVSVMWMYVLSAPVTDYATMESVYNGWVTEAVMAEDWNVILLINPLVGFASLMQNQTGETAALLMYGSDKTIPQFVREHWLMLGMAIQAVAIILCNLFSARKLAKKY